MSTQMQSSSSDIISSHQKLSCLTNPKAQISQILPFLNVTIKQIELCFSNDTEVQQLFQAITTQCSQLHSLIMDNHAAIHEQKQYLSHTQAQLVLPSSLKRLVLKGFAYPTYRWIVDAVKRHCPSLECVEIRGCRGPSTELIQLLHSTPSLQYVVLECNLSSDWLFDEGFGAISKNPSIHWVSLDTFIVQPTLEEWKTLGMSRRLKTLVWSHRCAPLNEALSVTLNGPVFTALDRLAVGNASSFSSKESSETLSSVLQRRKQLGIHTIHRFGFNALDQELPSHIHPPTETETLSVWDEIGLADHPMAIPPPPATSKRKAETALPPPANGVTGLPSSSSSEPVTKKQKHDDNTKYVKDYGSVSFVFDVPHTFANRFQPPLPLMTEDRKHYERLYLQHNPMKEEFARHFITQILQHKLVGEAYKPINYLAIIEKMMFRKSVKPLIAETKVKNPSILMYPPPASRTKSYRLISELKQQHSTDIQIGEVIGDKSMVAIKKLSLVCDQKSLAETEDVYPYWLTFLNEYRAYQHLRGLSPMIGSLRTDVSGYSESGGSVSIVTDYLSPRQYMSLNDFLSSPYAKKVTESYKSRVVGSLEEVLESVHQSGYCHNDTHLRNWMLHLPTGNVKLIDFELAMTHSMEGFISRRYGSVCGIITPRVGDNGISPNVVKRINDIAWNGKMYDKYVVHYACSRYGGYFTRLPFDSDFKPDKDLIKYQTVIKVPEQKEIVKTSLDLIQKLRFSRFWQYGYFMEMWENPPMVQPQQRNDRPNNHDLMWLGRESAQTMTREAVTIFTQRGALLPSKTDTIHIVKMYCGDSSKKNWMDKMGPFVYDKGDRVRKQMDALKKRLVTLENGCVGKWASPANEHTASLGFTSNKTLSPTTTPYTDRPSSGDMTQRVYDLRLDQDSSKLSEWKYIDRLSLYSKEPSMLYHYTTPPKKSSPYGMFVSELQFLNAVQGVDGFQQIHHAALDADSLCGIIETKNPPRGYVTLDSHLEELKRLHLKWCDNVQSMIAWKLCDLLSCLHSQEIMLSGSLTFDHVMFHPRTLDVIVKQGNYARTRRAEDVLLAICKPPNKLEFMGDQCDYLALSREFVRHGLTVGSKQILYAMPTNRKLSPEQIDSLQTESIALRQCKAWLDWFLIGSYQQQEKRFQKFKAMRDVIVPATTTTATSASSNSLSSSSTTAVPVPSAPPKH